MKITENLLQFLQDDVGNYSSTRAIKLSITALVMIMWAFVCFVNKTLVEIPDSALIIVLGSLGVGTIQKAIAEQKPESK